MPYKLALKAIGYHYNTCGVVVEACLALRRGNKTVRGVKVSGQYRPKVPEVKIPKIPQCGQ